MRDSVPIEVSVRPTRDYAACAELAATLPDYFTPAGLDALSRDLASGELYGALVVGRLVGLAVYIELNPQVVELAWLAVDRRHWSRGVGTQLVEASLLALPSGYRVCEVKTVAATAADEGYARTRRFYAKLGFIPLEIIDPYPGWERGNPCQIMVRCLSGGRSADERAGAQR